ncbi:helix-turn-helix domain-containing protein [Streptomyces sp. NBC_00306]|uniref:helix-turn-helix domain-containing protein n=1 Tax=Streptomyces sp. NBC_00306 TaxID=2975708 RepID=UPI003FA7090F
MRPHSSAIRYRREALNLSLTAVARLSGIHPSHLSRVETGKAGLSDGNIRRLATALDASTDDITHKETP